jgi:phage shock protein E
MRIVLASILLVAAPLSAAEIAPQVDFDGFEALTSAVRPDRAKHLLTFPDFQKRAARGETLLLDARSSDAFAAGHIVGAVNLPLTDFTAESLAEVIGADTDRPILIYCNNNFSNHIRPVALKAAPLALNIQTFINLKGYGYSNIWELGDVVDFTDPQVGWIANGQLLRS